MNSKIWRAVLIVNVAFWAVADMQHHYKHLPAWLNMLFDLALFAYVATYIWRAPTPVK